ncbi:hypothetical protein Fot_24608 [Forsythia ovata]|uniref:Uncharacterized protein n=1 Tax=Forsythia ovata TaxID=205694 RepID=A0ABD1U7Y9_9LAMI
MEKIKKPACYAPIPRRVLGKSQSQCLEPATAIQGGFPYIRAITNQEGKIPSGVIVQFKKGIAEASKPETYSSKQESLKQQNQKQATEEKVHSKSDGRKKGEFFS